MKCICWGFPAEVTWIGLDCGMCRRVWVIRGRFEGQFSSEIVLCPYVYYYIDIDNSGVASGQGRVCAMCTNATYEGTKISVDTKAYEHQTLLKKSISEFVRIPSKQESGFIIYIFFF